MKNLETNIFIQGDCIEEMGKIPSCSVDMVFADPPYNLQLGDSLTRPNNSKVKGVTNSWDKFATFKEYDTFTKKWLKQVRRILKPTGTMWTIGSYHNIFRVGKTIQDLGFWILNDVIWVKTNPMPNFRGTRMTNAHETLIWAAKSKDNKYTFNYHALKALNEDLQMRSDWFLPICTGEERIKNTNGDKAHPTQKPESLLYRAIIASTNPRDIILDPFCGTGTTSAVCKKLGRKFICIEEDACYLTIAKNRTDPINEISDYSSLNMTVERRKETRIPFGSLLECGMVTAGQKLISPCKKYIAQVRADGSIISDAFVGSIHKVGAQVQQAPSCNGWTYWHVKSDSTPIPIDTLRKKMRIQIS